GLLGAIARSGPFHLPSWPCRRDAAVPRSIERALGGAAHALSPRPSDVAARPSAVVSFAVSVVASAVAAAALAAALPPPLLGERARPLRPQPALVAAAHRLPAPAGNSPAYETLRAPT